MLKTICAKAEKLLIVTEDVARGLESQVVARIVQWALVGVLIAFGLLSAPLFMRQLSYIVSLNDDVGYYDSYFLYDVLHFQKTGVIYRDLSLPPYVPAAYSPALYVLYSLPGRIVEFANPILGPRIVALAAFILCIGIVISIIRTLIPVRFAWMWGVLLICSTADIWPWILQIRADFPGICFTLLAIRLLLLRSPWAVYLSAICAGLATQFKFVFVSALVTGVLWLFVRRQWKDLAGFAILGTVFSVGLYFLYSLREPGMFSQIFAVSPGIIDLKGDLRIIYTTVREPAVLLAVVGLPRGAYRIGQRGALIVIFAAISFLIAGLTDLHVGGAGNYFLEPLFAVVPLAVLGVLRLMALVRQNVLLGIFFTTLFGVHFLIPRALEVRRQLGPEAFPSVRSRNESFLLVEQALRGSRIFATVPRLAVLDPAPSLTEPYIFSYLQMLGKINPQPILERIRDSEFDIVITLTHAEMWRGVPLIGRNLHDTITASYEPLCELPGNLGFTWLMQLPRQPHDGTNALAQRLANIGCAPVIPDHGASTLRW